MNPLDNAQGGPIIPAGTEKTVYGTASFQPQVTQQTVVNNGQATQVPVVSPSTQPDAPQGTTFAELAAKKGFQNPDDLARAYANLESHNKKVEMTAADIIKAVQEPQQVVVNNPAYMIPPQMAQQYVPPIQTQVTQAANPDEAAIQIVRGIVQNEVKPLQQTVELQQLFLNNPDAKEYATGIAEVVKRNPGIKWEDAYKLAKFDSAQQQAVVQGQQQAYETIQQKQAVMAGTPSPTQRATPDLSSVIRDRTVPFKEVDRMVRETLARLQ